MKKPLSLFLALALYGSIASAQVVPMAPTNLIIDGGTSVPTAPAGNWPQPPMTGMPVVNAAKSIVLKTGATAFNVGPTGLTVGAGDGTGAFRITCDPSHMNFDDPLVYPGASNAGRAHHHTFWGNTSTWAGTNLDSLRTQGGSTCAGGTANKSAYWVPTMIDTRTGTPRAPDFIIVYYKSGYGHNQPLSDIQEFPQGLKMLAGTPMKNTPYASTDVGQPAFHCHNGTPDALHKQQTIPNCAVGASVLAELPFPNCWDGKNLDSPDHKSHVGYSQNTGFRCPAGWVLMPTITFSLYYDIKAGESPSSWVLSSDMKDANGNYRPGQSFHGDWINGWDPDIERAWLNNCVKAAVDCHANILGDGRALN